MSRLIARHPDLGDLVLHSDPQEPARPGEGWIFQTVTGDFGDPDASTKAIDETIGSLLEVDRWGNRSVSLGLLCSAPDGEALALAEQALARYLVGRFELVWEPIADFAQPVSFWIEPGSKWSRTSEPSGVEWDLAELMHSRRFWQVTLTARPFVLDAADTITSWALSGNQGSNEITVGGVAPANAGLTISAGAGLGKVVAHVASTGLTYNPSLRARMTSSTATLVRASAPAFAGTTWRLLTGSTFSIPANTLPVGPYELVAHLHSETAQTISIPWTIQSKVGAANVGPAWSGTSDPITFAAGQDLLVGLGKITLPLIQSEDPAATLLLTFGTAPVYLDEAWPFWIPDEDAALVIGDLGAGAAAVASAYSRLEVRAPSVTEPKQLLRVGVGSAATIGGSHIVSADRIIVKPGPVQVYAATAGTTNANVALSVRHAFHDHTVGAAS